MNVSLFLRYQFDLLLWSFISYSFINCTTQSEKPVQYFTERARNQSVSFYTDDKWMSLFFLDITFILSEAHPGLFLCQYSKSNIYLWHPSRSPWSCHIHVSVSNLHLPSPQNDKQWFYQLLKSIRQISFWSFISYSFYQLYNSIKKACTTFHRDSQCYQRRDLHAQLGVLASRCAP